MVVIKLALADGISRWPNEIHERVTKLTKDESWREDIGERGKAMFRVILQPRMPKGKPDDMMRSYMTREQEK